jgi:hypothetical protein
MEQAATLVSFADKPLVVLTAGSGSAADWLSKQETLAALSTNSAHRVIAGATHSAFLMDEKNMPPLRLRQSSMWSGRCEATCPSLGEDRSIQGKTALPFIGHMFYT